MTLTFRTPHLTPLLYTRCLPGWPEARESITQHVLYINLFYTYHIVDLVHILLVLEYENSH